MDQISQFEKIPAVSDPKEPLTFGSQKTVTAVITQPQSGLWLFIAGHQIPFFFFFL